MTHKGAVCTVTQEKNWCDECTVRTVETDVLRSEQLIFCP